MNRSTIAGIVAAGLLFGGTAVAAEKPGQWYVAPMISTIWVDNDRLVDDDFGAALAIGRALTDNINLEFHTFGYQLDGLDETDYWGIGLDVVRVFYRDERISPYLLGGGGWNVKNREFGRDSKDTYANFAFGLLTDLKPGGSVALRTELRHRIDFFSRASDGRSTSYRDLMLNIGLQVPFGQPYAQPMVAEPVAAPPPPPPPRPAPPPPPPPPPPVPDIISLEGVHFAFASEQVIADERGLLREAVDTLKNNPQVRVEAAGHTDSVGSATFNQGLSERRARAVRDYLVANGIAPERVTYRGYGLTMPVADNATDEGRAANRRVELRVIK